MNNLASIIRLQLGILDAGGETRAVLGYVGQLTMADDAGSGILGSELLQQFIESVLLSLGTGIGTTAFLVQTTLIDNAQGTVVVVAGMDALDSLWQQGYDIAITAYIVVVATLAVLGFSAGNEVLHAERAVALVGHAVDNDELDRLQWFHNNGFNGLYG